MTVTPYLTADDLREAKVLDRMDRFSDTTLEDLVAEYEELIERECGVAFTARVATDVVVRGTARTTLVLPHVKVGTPTAIAIDGTAFTSGELADVTVWADEGTLYRDAGWCGTQVVLSYPYGFASPPAAVLRGCREFVRAKATKGAGNAPRDAAGPAGVDGTSYPVASTKPTGVREVDLNIIPNLPHYRIPGIG